MPVQNAEIATRLEELADLLEIEGADAFRVRAYRNAAAAVRSSTRSLAERVAAGEDLTKLAGIGKSIAAKIQELVETRDLEVLHEVEERTPAPLADLLRLPGLGPKRVHALHDALGVTTRADLLRAARDHRVRALPGFGAKTEEQLVRALEATDDRTERTPWVEVEPVAEALAAHLRGVPGVREVAVAGSFRRRAPTVGDLDLVVSSRDGARPVAAFVEYEDVREVRARGTTRATAVLANGLQVDLRVVRPESFGAALHYFTGAKAHNIALRRRGQERGWKVNEYGVFRGAERLAGRTEEEVYGLFDLPVVPPELREDRGELEAAAEGRLPRLLELADVRGDLHVHSTASDGRDDVEALARAALARGYRYLAITDHSRSSGAGLDARGMRRHMRAIERVDARLDGIALLKGVEVDIRKDGSLDLPDALLADLDVVVAAIHRPYDLGAGRQTERLLRALDRPHVHAIAHPTGRLFGAREAYPLDLDRLVAGVAERGAWLELNAQPKRFDLPEAACRAAKEAGVRIVLATDAHGTEQLDLMRFGVGLARRAWLEKRDVVNTRTLAQLRKMLARR